MSIENKKVLSVVSELWSEAEKESLVKVSGISMEPMLQDGESIVVDHVKKDLKFGDIGVFNRDGITVVHRVLWKRRAGEKIFYGTKGDWMLHMDAPVESATVMGKVSSVTRQGRRYNLNTSGSIIYSRIMALHSLMMAMDGKVAYLLDKGIGLLTGQGSEINGEKGFRFFRKLFLYGDRFLHRIFYRLFFRLFNKLDHRERPF